MTILKFVEEDSTTDRQAIELLRGGIDVVIIKDVPDLSKGEERTVRMCRLLCRDELIAEIIWKELFGTSESLEHSGAFFGSVCLLCGYSEILKFLKEKAIGTIVKI